MAYDQNNLQLIRSQFNHTIFSIVKIAYIYKRLNKLFIENLIPKV